MPRLLQPFINKQVSTTSPGWQLGGFDGHVGDITFGPSIHYAARRSLHQGLLKARIDSMIACLKTCQEAAVQWDPKMEHYLGGVPDSKTSGLILPRVISAFITDLGGLV